MSLIVKNLGYFVEPAFLFSTIIEAIGRKENILPQLERSLKKIEDSTIGQESEDDFGGLFSDIDLASPKLGKTADDKNRLISDVLMALNGIDFGLEEASDIDILGDAYEYMIGQFAAGAGKKAGECFQRTDRFLYFCAVHFLHTVPCAEGIRQQPWCFSHRRYADLCQP